MSESKKKDKGLTVLLAGGKIFIYLHQDKVYKHESDLPEKDKDYVKRLYQAAYAFFPNVKATEGRILEMQGESARHNRRFNISFDTFRVVVGEQEVISVH